MAMVSWMFAALPTLCGDNGIEYRFPFWFWMNWPLSSNDNCLMFLRNTWTYKFDNVSWHSTRHFPQYHSTRYRMLQAVVNGKIDDIQDCLNDGWDIQATIDHAQRYNAASLAAHLDKLEVLHYLDMKGADLNKGAGKLNFTPLMCGVMNWNVRIIDYLTERGVDPYVKDKYGFTAIQKAKIKQYKTIQSMLQAYEAKYNDQKNFKPIPSVTSKEWQDKIKNINVDDYTVIEIWKEDNATFAKYKPSQLIKLAEYPFANFDFNQFILAIGHDYHFFNSADKKMIP